MPTTPAVACELGDRRVRFDLERMEAAWNPRYPELSFAADAVSLLMPYAEPYFVRSVRAALPDLDPDLRRTAAAFCAQESRHQGEHRRFNDRLVTEHPGLGRIERWIARTFRTLERRASSRFSLAFAASSETIAFSIARWSDRHHHDLYDDVDPAVAAVFQWHLAEEVEHKSVAFDVHRAVDGSALRRAAAGALTFAVLAWFTVLTLLALMAGSGRWRSPACWLRLPRWALGIAFVTLPDLLASCRPGHHPSDLADPPGLVTWLRGFGGEPAGGRTG